MRDVGLRVAAVIDDLELETLRAPGDRLADPPEAQDPHCPAVQRRGEGERTRRPFARAQETLCLGQAAHRHDGQRHRDVGDFVVEHARRVGHDDSMLARPFSVDMLVADAETGDDLELRQPAHDACVDRELMPVRGQRPQPRPLLCEPRFGIGLEPQAIQRQPLGDQIVDHAHAPRGHHDVEWLPSFHPASSLPLSRRRRTWQRPAHGKSGRRSSRATAPSRAPPDAQGFPLLCGARSHDRRAVSSSYAARTAPARPISSRRSHCSRRGGACAGRSSPNAPAGAALAALRSRSKSTTTARGVSLGRAGRQGTERAGPSG